MAIRLIHEHLARTGGAGMSSGVLSGAPTTEQ